MAYEWANRMMGGPRLMSEQPIEQPMVRPHLPDWGGHGWQLPVLPVTREEVSAPAQTNPTTELAGFWNRTFDPAKNMKTAAESMNPYGDIAQQYMNQAMNRVNGLGLNDAAEAAARSRIANQLMATYASPAANMWKQLTNLASGNMNQAATITGTNPWEAAAGAGLQALGQYGARAVGAMAGANAMPTQLGVWSGPTDQGLGGVLSSGGFY